MNLGSGREWFWSKRRLHGYPNTYGKERKATSPIFVGVLTCSGESKELPHPCCVSSQLGVGMRLTFILLLIHKNKLHYCHPLLHHPSDHNYGPHVGEADYVPFILQMGSVNRRGDKHKGKTHEGLCHRFKHWNNLKMPRLFYIKRGTDCGEASLQVCLPSCWDANAERQLCPLTPCRPKA